MKAWLFFVYHYWKLITDHYHNQIMRTIIYSNIAHLNHKKLDIPYPNICILFLST